MIRVTVYSKHFKYEYDLSDYKNNEYFLKDIRGCSDIYFKDEDIKSYDNMSVMDMFLFIVRHKNNDNDNEMVIEFEYCNKNYYVSYETLRR